MSKTLTIERLQNVLYYERGSGRFFWTKTFNSRIQRGDQAGTMLKNGYWQITIDCEFYLEHRLAWFWCNGDWPNGKLDHADGNIWNNRIGNLRVATTSQNGANARTSALNTSGYKGVSWDKSRGMWSAFITVDCKHIYLGRFTELSMAAQAYRDAAREHFGEFARYEEV